MKIKCYPGKAVDASLSLDASNAMGVLYEANWLQAHQNFGNTTTTGRETMPKLNLLDGASTLGKYQKTLEQIRALEQQTKDERIVWTIKDLNGYKPSTLRRKPRNLNCDWDNPAEDSSVVSTAATTNHYVADPTEKQLRPRQQVSIQPPILKRSQTMAARPTSNNSCSTLDIKDLRKMWRAERATKVKSGPTRTESVVGVVSTQPQRQVNMLTTPALPLDNCDSNISPSISKTPPIPMPRMPGTVNRAKTVRFPTFERYRTPPKPPPRTTTLIGKQSVQVPAQKPNIVHAEKQQAYSSRKTSRDKLSDSFAGLACSSYRTPIQTRRQVNSASSTQSNSQSSIDSDQFIIPRPRLIVPIHTYARKRKTGNLQDQDVEVLNNDTARDGKKKTFKLQSSYYLSRLYHF